MTETLTTAPPGRATAFAEGAMTVAEASRFCGLGRTHLYELMAGGRLAYAKIGARRLIARRGLIDLLAGAGPDAAA